MTLKNMFYNILFVNIWILGSYSKLDNMNWINGISIFISGLALLVSLGCLCHVIPRELGIDYLGWIVGVLALLTAILLGWQIFSLFNIKRIEDEVKKKYEESYHKTERALAEAHMAMWAFHCATANDASKEDLIFSQLQNCVSAVTHLLRIREYGIASSYLTSGAQKLRPMISSGVRIDSDLVDVLLRDCLNIDNPTHIQGFHEFYSTLIEYRKTLD